MVGCQNALVRLAKQPVPASFTNIIIDSVNVGIPYKPCEPSIYINPLNTDNVVAGVVLNKTLYSVDGGRTWKLQYVKSPYGVFGDPVIIADYLGNFYFAHLSDTDNRGRMGPGWIDRIVIQKSMDGGATWNEGSYAGHRAPADQDKHWLGVDPKNNNLYVTWTEFDKYGSSNKNDHSRILFSRSTDQANSWSEAIQISQYEGDCLDGDQTTEGAVPCVGLNGEVFVAWAYDDRIYFDRSLDKGITWLDDDIIAAQQIGGWDFTIPGFGRANGMPVTGCDLSKSPYRGTVYINYCDQSNGEDDTDVWLVKSVDGG
ncbi:MAG: exo-alpha-sialidase, partial [Saprospiraceae bacterium]|nr:exo-alpha-sialidase [Saprospiraceae bacterium]